MEKRFECIFKEGRSLGRRFEIWRDNLTGVCYLCALKDDEIRGFSVLYDAEGKPMVMSPEEGETAARDLDWTQI